MGNKHITELNNVRQWMTDMHQNCPRDFVDARNDIAELRHKLISEEYKEWQAAAPMSNALLDALCDLLYVTYGSFAHLGLAFDESLTYTKLSLTGKKIAIDHYVAMALSALTKRPLCRLSIEPSLTKLILAIYQAGEANGFDLSAAFDIVHKSNYTKFWTKEEVKAMNISPALTSYKPTLGKFVVFNAYGKVTKPPSFSPPNLQPIVIAALRQFERGSAPAPIPAASTKTADQAAGPAVKPPAPPPRPVAAKQSRSKTAPPLPAGG